MEPITLADSELATCRMIGNMRAICARSNNVNDTIVNKGSGLEMDEWGVVGEYAFCKLNNIFFDPSISPRSGSYDFVFHGVRFDMKTTTLKDGQLLATMKQNKDVDAFALAILTNNVVTFPGYCLARDMYKPENIKNLGRGEGYAIPQLRLRRWKTNEESKDNSKDQG
jgi:hypothetical protein